jgi:hypothetical protein
MRYLGLGLALASLLFALPVSAQPVRLDYNQQKLLRDAEGYLRDVDRDATKIESSLAELAKQPIERASYKSVSEALATHQTLLQKLTNVQNRLDQLPAEHESVAAVATKRSAAATRLSAIETQASQLKTALDTIRDPANYPDFDADIERLEQLTSLFARSSALQDRPDAAIETLTAWPRLDAFYAKIVKTYQGICYQETPQGQRMLAKVKHFATQHIEFIKASYAYLAHGPKQVQTAIEGALQMARQAAAEQKPGFFSGGVAQQLGQAQDRLRVLQALVAPEIAAILKHKGRNDPNAAGAVDAATQRAQDLAATLAGAQQEIATLQRSMTSAIVAANRLPLTAYSGGDRDELLAGARAAWSKRHPDDKLIDARITMNDWERNSGWRWHDATTSWDRYDYSILRVLVVIQLDDQRAQWCVVVVSKNHLQGDKLSYGPEDRDLEQPQRQLLLTNLK